MTEISIVAEEIFRLGDFRVTNSLFIAVILVLVLLSGAVYFRRKISLVPGKLQSAVEMVLEAFLGLMDSILGSREKSERYLPLVVTIFLFILFSNWMGLLPLVNAVGLHEGHHLIPIFRAPSSDLNFTIALAIIAVAGINIFALGAVGFKKHLSKFFTLKSPIMSFTGVLELISEFVRIISFSFRLFGNIFAGEVLLIIIGFLLPYVVPLPFLFLEVFVGFIQAFIFAMLTLVFIAAATSEEGAH